ncbi:hypothetical protein Pla175_01330 [Pirellulimonas nuda]|uniref:Uncharacterized protein n=1 Tax=Pirellulimonas nuda TaxID=2528009 RepID=A0A518D5M5_9BACT|nr:hypothetical protein [Pirellulimonas nuda]QDU86782.1 hypothetical protein Pla175_01330 [Pirellulimonas nuda]
MDTDYVIAVAKSQFRGVLALASSLDAALREGTDTLRIDDLGSELRKTVDSFGESLSNLQLAHLSRSVRDSESPLLVPASALSNARRPLLDVNYELQVRTDYWRTLAQFSMDFERVVAEFESFLSDVASPVAEGERPEPESITTRVASPGSLSPVEGSEINWKNSPETLRELWWVPQLDRENGEWVRNKRAAVLEGLTVQTLRTYRGLGKSDTESCLGEDPDGRVWRKNGSSNTHPWYLRSTLKSERKAANKTAD